MPLVEGYCRRFVILNGHFIDAIEYAAAIYGRHYFSLRSKSIHS